jgi:hypothetical protein
MRAADFRYLVDIPEPMTTHQNFRMKPNTGNDGVSDLPSSCTFNPADLFTRARR